MQKALLNLLRSASSKQIAIIGLSKNAGKTSVLNYLLQALPSQKCGVMSTGLDGEELDSIFGNPKPAVKLAGGTIFCCDASTIDLQGSKIRIIDKLKWSRGTGHLWLAEALADIETRILGPAGVEEQLQCAHSMQTLGARKVFIDGALDRKSIVFGDSIDFCILVAGASFGTLPSIITELKTMDLLSSIPYTHSLPPKSLRQSICIKHKRKWVQTGFESLFDNEAAIAELLIETGISLYIPGAFGEESYNILKKSIKKTRPRLVFRHPYSIKLGFTCLERLLQTTLVEVAIPFKIGAIALNSLAVGTADADAFMMRQSIRQEFPHKIVFDLMEVE